MKNNLRYLAVVFAAVLSLAACGSGDDETSAVDSAAADTAGQADESADDQSEETAETEESQSDDSAGGDDGGDESAGSSGGGDDAELVAALKASMESDIGGLSDLEFDAQCAAESLVNGVGGADQAAAKYGVTPETVSANVEFDVELEQADAEAFVDGFWECGDLLTAMTEGLTEGGSSPEDAACMAENLDPEPFKAGLVAEFTGASADAADSGADLFGSVMAAMVACDVSLDSLGG